MTREEAINIYQGLINPRIKEAFEFFAPELAESEDERMLREIKRYIKEQGNKPTGLPNGTVAVADMIAWLEKQKENIEKEYVFRPLAGTEIIIAAEQAIRRANEGDSLVLAFNGAYIPVRKGCNANKIVDIYDAFIEKQKEQPTNEEMLRTLRLEYEKGVADTVSKYEQKEQKPADYDHEMWKNCEVNFEGGKKEVINNPEKYGLTKQRPTECTELTWKDIVELEGIINNVHYDFSAGIGQESFGKEVLERFRNKKDDAEVDACEQEQMEADLEKEALEILIPELTENEDERIRKELINFILYRAGRVLLDKETEHRFVAYLDKQKEQNPAEWSNTDKIGWDEAFACVTRAEKAAKNEEELQNAVTAEKWLKEIKFKYYVHPVKQEWNEEERDRVAQYLHDRDGGMLWSKATEITSDILDILRPQPRWKPSEEQMEAFRSYIKDFQEKAEAAVGGWNNFDVMIRLFEQLKKLM